MAVYSLRLTLEEKRASFCSYNLDKNNVSTHLQVIINTLDSLSHSHDKFILIGDFSAEQKRLLCQVSISNFLVLKNLVKQKTFLRNPKYPSCMDLVLIDSKSHRFQNITTFEVGLSDFHKLVATVLNKSKIFYHTETVNDSVTCHLEEI